MRTLYRKMNERIRPDAQLVAGVLSQAEHKAPRRLPVRAAFAAAALIVCLAVPALAANLPGTYPLLYRLAPDVAQFFRPLHLASEDQGIRLEVLSVRVAGDTAQALLGLTDLTGSRVDGTVDLYDSYEIHVPGGVEGHCSAAEYDETTGAATLLLTLTRKDGKAFDGEKVTLTVGELLCSVQTSDFALPADCMDMLCVQPETMQPGNRLRGMGGVDKSALPAQPTVLVPFAEERELAEGVTLSALGEVDGRLRLQLHFPSSATDDHGYVWFEDAQGKKTDPVYGIDFWDGNGGYYAEEVFAQSADELKGQTLRAHFVTCRTKVSGNWAVTFPITEE